MCSDLVPPGWSQGAALCISVVLFTKVSQNGFITNINQDSSHLATHSLSFLVRAEQTECYIQMKLQEQVETGRKDQTGNLPGTHSNTTALVCLITRVVRTVILALQMKDQVLYFLTPFHRISSDSPSHWKNHDLLSHKCLKRKVCLLVFSVPWCSYYSISRQRVNK